MSHRIMLLIFSSVVSFAGVALGNDEVTVRSKDKPHKGPIKSESSRGVEITGLKETIPAEDIVDILYDANPAGVRVTIYRPAAKSEQEYNDQAPKKAAQR